MLAEAGTIYSNDSCWVGHVTDNRVLPTCQCTLITPPRQQRSAGWTEGINTDVSAGLVANMKEGSSEMVAF